MGRTKESDTGQEMFKVRSSMVRHLNKQTISADSSVAIAESIANPAYREAASDEYLGILLVAVTMDAKYTAPFGTCGAGAHRVSSQVQYGDQSSSPALMDRDNQFLHAHGHAEIAYATAVGFSLATWTPMPLRKLHPDDVIVTPDFTIAHDFGINNAAYASKEVQTELLYHIVEVPDKVFTRMLMDQTRTS